MMPRTSGYQEKTAKQRMPAARNTYASALSATRRRTRLTVRTTMASADLLDLGEDLVDLGLRRRQQLVEVGVPVGQHLLHRHVEHRVDLLRVRRLELDRDRPHLGDERRVVLLRNVRVLLV